MYSNLIFFIFQWALNGENKLPVLAELSPSSKENFFNEDSSPKSKNGGKEEVSEKSYGIKTSNIDIEMKSFGLREEEVEHSSSGDRLL